MCVYVAFYCTQLYSYDFPVQMTRSVGDLSCVSHKSLSWANRGAPVNQEGNESEDTPTDSHQDDVDNKGTCTLHVCNIL